jgi:hypothetical protein
MIRSGVEGASKRAIQVLLDLMHHPRGTERMVSLFISVALFSIPRDPALIEPVQEYAARISSCPECVEAQANLDNVLIHLARRNP